MEITGCSCMQCVLDHGPLIWTCEMTHQWDRTLFLKPCPATATQSRRACSLIGKGKLRGRSGQPELLITSLRRPATPLYSDMSVLEAPAAEHTPPNTVIRGWKHIFVCGWVAREPAVSCFIQLRKEQSTVDVLSRPARSHFQCEG